MFRSIKAIINGLTGEFDDREKLVECNLPSVEVARRERYDLDGEEFDEKEIEEIEGETMNYLAFGYAKAFTPFKVSDREAITRWLAEDGIAIVDLSQMKCQKDKNSVVAWLQGVAHMQQKQFQELRIDLYLIGLIAAVS